MSKKTIRAAFRRAVFTRDKFCCKCCGKPGKDRQGGEDHLKFHKDTADLVSLDSHHIMSRDKMPGGGYVAQNGITVCDECHLLAEHFWVTGVAAPGFSIDDLYKKIGANYSDAITVSSRLPK